MSQTKVTQKLREISEEASAASLLLRLRDEERPVCDVGSGQHGAK